MLFAHFLRYVRNTVNPLGQLIKLTLGILAFSELLKNVGLTDSVAVRLSHEDGERIRVLITRMERRANEDETPTYHPIKRVHRLGISGLTFEWPTRKSTSKEAIATLLHDATKSSKSTDPQEDES